MTVGQLNEYIKGWSDAREEQYTPSPEDITLFNLSSGIERKKVRK